MLIDTMVPIYLADGDEIPKTGTFYVVGSNGTFIHKDNGFFTTVREVHGISLLEEYNTNSVLYNLPKIDAVTCAKIKLFFQLVVEKYRSESVVILYYNQELNSYATAVPQQTINHASAVYIRKGLTANEHLQGYVPIGTIHSHCDFGAFHSGTDDSDETDWDGLHITFGNNDLEDFSITASIITGDERIAIDPQNLIEGIQAKDHHNEVMSRYFNLNLSLDPYLEEVQGWLGQILTPDEYNDLVLKMLVDDDEKN